jgi:hypothetical protein
MKFIHVADFFIFSNPDQGMADIQSCGDYPHPVDPVRAQAYIRRIQTTNRAVASGAATRQ